MTLTAADPNFDKRVRASFEKQRLMTTIGAAIDSVSPGRVALRLHELGDVVDEYRKGFVPLIVPITLLRHHVRRLGQAYLEEQVYLNPHPKELMLRNHV